MFILYLIIGIAAVITLWFIATYNGFNRLKNQTDEAWADIDVQLKRRYDLIPNLISTVKGYAAHEQGTLDKITQARAQAMQAGTMEEKSGAENVLTGALKSLFAVAENYPDLKANQNFLELQRELSDTENKIQAARRFYNTNVRDFKIKLANFPSNLVGQMFNFQAPGFFEIAEGEKAAAAEPVKVQF